MFFWTYNVKQSTITSATQAALKWKMVIILYYCSYSLYNPGCTENSCIWQLQQMLWHYISITFYFLACIKVKKSFVSFAHGKASFINCRFNTSKLLELIGNMYARLHVWYRDLDGRLTPLRIAHYLRHLISITSPRAVGILCMNFYGLTLTTSTLQRLASVITVGIMTKPSNYNGEWATCRPSVIARLPCIVKVEYQTASQTVRALPGRRPRAVREWSARWSGARWM